MEDDQKTKAELLQEVETLRRRVVELEQAEDVTERKRAEEEWRAFEERFRNLAERSFDLIFMTDAQGYLTYISTASEKIFHYKPEEMAGTHFKNYLVKSEIPRVSQRFAENMKGKNLGIFRMEAMRKDGSHVFIELNSAPIVKDGETIGIQGIIRDITERKRMEEALRESEEKYRSVVENIGIGVSLISPKMEILALNRQLKESFPDIDVSKKPICYKSFNNPPGENICSYCPTYKSLKDGHVHESITKTPAGDKIVNWRIISSPIKDKDGKVIAAIEMTEEITERKKAEEALRESEERYKALFEGAAEGIIVADTETKQFKYVNPAICKMLGYTEEKLGRLGVSDIYPKEYLEYVVSEFEAQARGEKTLSTSIPCLRKDGTIIYADINTAMVLVDRRQCNVGFFTDITERKRMEEALLDSQERLQLAVSGTNLGLWDWNVQTGEAVYNRQWAEMLGYTIEEIEPNANSWKRLVHPGDAPQMMEILNLHFEKKTPFYETEFRMRTKSGGWKYILSVGRVFEWDDDGKPLRMTGTHRDITEHKKAEEELNEYREKMARAEQLASLGTLSATLAHELNQPLTTIRLSIENSLADLETTSCPGTITEGLKDGLTGVSHAASIVERFRNFARKSSEKIVGQVDLKVVAERIVNLLNESARRAKVALRLKGMDKLPHIHSNEKDLEQLFFALVDNAIEAADGKKSRKLIISGAIKDEQIELRFSDDCGGIATENLDKIFEPFFTTRPAGEGTGLGLCIVQRIVSRAGGKVRVESKPGKGSTFFVTLPIKSRRS